VIRRFFQALLILPSLAFAQSNTISSTVCSSNTIDRTPPAANAPTIIGSNPNVCMFGTSVGVTTQILGFAAGTQFRDETCTLLALSNSLYRMNMKIAGISILCLHDRRVWDAMWHAGTVCPHSGKIGDEAKELWLANPDDWPTANKASNISGGNVISGGWARDKRGNVIYEKD